MTVYVTFVGIYIDIFAAKNFENFCVGESALDLWMDTTEFKLHTVGSFRHQQPLNLDYSQLCLVEFCEIQRKEER
jgi:hypothetical protein